MTRTKTNVKYLLELTPSKKRKENDRPPSGLRAEISENSCGLLNFNPEKIFQLFQQVTVPGITSSKDSQKT